MIDQCPDCTVMCRFVAHIVCTSHSVVTINGSCERMVRQTLSIVMCIPIAQNSKLLQKCTMLEKNLSCLFKTAWAHLRRKDEYIEALKIQIKDFRKLTGMVAPGVQHDGNLAASSDGSAELGQKCVSELINFCNAQTCKFGPGKRHCRPVNIQQWSACRRKRYERQDRPLQDLRHHVHTKQAKFCDGKTRSDNLNQGPQTSAIDEKRMYLSGCYGKQPWPLKADRPHERDSDPCYPAHDKRGYADSYHEYHPPPACKPKSSGKHHGASARGGHAHPHPARTHQAGLASGPHEGNHGARSRSHGSNSAAKARESPGSSSTSPTPRQHRVRPQRDTLLADGGAEDSPQALNIASGVGDLRRRRTHAHSTSRVSPRSHR